MRYKGASGDKILWRCEALGWAAVGVNTLPAFCAITWADEGTPWAVFRTEDALYNVEVEDLIRSGGL